LTVIRKPRSKKKREVTALNKEENAMTTGKKKKNNASGGEWDTRTVTNFSRRKTVVLRAERIERPKKKKHGSTKIPRNTHSRRGSDDSPERKEMNVEEGGVKFTGEKKFGQPEPNSKKRVTQRLKGEKGGRCNPGAEKRGRAIGTGTGKFELRSINKQRRAHHRQEKGRKRKTLSQRGENVSTVLGNHQYRRRVIPLM